jgi:hypothetical protein
LLLGVGLYYGVLAFNLGATFWIAEPFMGLSGLLMHLPVLALLLLRLVNQQPGGMCAIWFLPFKRRRIFSRS